jgi:tetratricopeptide (TPR) repeat protein
MKINLSATQLTILALLPQFESLPLPVIGEALASDQETIDKDAMALLDLAILNIDEHGYYAVSDPVRDVVPRILGGTFIPYDKIADAIDNYIEGRDPTERETELLPLLRAQYKAHVLAGRGRSGLFRLSGDLTKLQQRFYHDQEYSRSIDFGLEALNVRPKQLDALRYLARAYSQLERYTDAELTIAAIRSQSPKEAAFLEGFLAKKQGRTDDAASAYKRAIVLGMRGAAVHRELGQVLFELGDYVGARQHLTQADEADPNNKFVVDYAVQVAIAERSFAEAEILLGRLQRIEETTRYEHRRSTYELAKGNILEAFAASTTAMDSSPRPHFEVIAQYTKLAIYSKKPEEAERGLEMLSKRFGGIRSDIQNGLLARYLLMKGQVEDAEATWNKIKRKDTIVHKRIRASILENYIDKVALPPDVRARYKAELVSLEPALKGQDLEALENDLS